MHHYKSRFLSLLAALMLLLMSFGPVTLSSYAQGSSRTFPETGKTVSGSFLQYWTAHGGLAQQGYPISDSMPEVSDTNGKTYVVQYFERAVFEAHPENIAPNDVLLSLLGVFRFKQKYPGGAPGPLPNAEANSHLFVETGKHAGGLFLTYWQTHGALAQQGFPISEEFTEVSDLNGKPYKVQYFERAVFELHPENPAPYNVLLSQLGRFRYNAKYPSGPKPGNTPAPQNSPVPPPDACSGIPGSQNTTITPICGPQGTDFAFEGRGFQPGEDVGIYVTEPSQAVFGAPFQETADSAGTVSGIGLQTDRTFDPGIWAVTMEGTTTHNKAIGYFKITGPGPGATPNPGDTSCSNVPTSQNMQILPSNCARVGTQFIFNGRGFQPGESIGVYVTAPDQSVFGAPFQTTANSSGGTNLVTFSTQPSFPLGVWAITMEGTTSHSKAIGYFKLIP